MDEIIKNGSQQIIQKYAYALNGQKKPIGNSEKNSERNILIYLFYYSRQEVKVIDMWEVIYKYIFFNYCIFIFDNLLPKALFVSRRINIKLKSERVECILFMHIFFLEFHDLQ